MNSAAASDQERARFAAQEAWQGRTSPIEPDKRSCGGFARGGHRVELGAGGQQDGAGVASEGMLHLFYVHRLRVDKQGPAE
ncbi:hypothetical protein V2J94_03615 [Streptomyces sp. DSM 41524]|uniref:Uncharacterized protein n=1 Tax=Streptomyces asiaticus subsp. ignotus TaxID=3098222 RepID=A0ABU7PPJ8_9ACTN|nr:hypothetical protein [Streptomyces sp. DSM 41524]